MCLTKMAKVGDKRKSELIVSSDLMKSVDLFFFFHPDSGEHAKAPDMHKQKHRNTHTHTYPKSDSW